MSNTDMLKSVMLTAKKLNESAQKTATLTECAYEQAAADYINAVIKDCGYEHTTFRLTHPPHTVVKLRVEGTRLVGYAWCAKKKRWYAAVSVFAAESTRSIIQNMFTPYSDDASVTAADIMWDTDRGPKGKLPKFATVPLAFLEERTWGSTPIPNRQNDEYWDSISDTLTEYLADAYGMTHDGYRLVKEG